MLDITIFFENFIATDVTWLEQKWFQAHNNFSMIFLVRVKSLHKNIKEFTWFQQKSFVYEKRKNKNLAWWAYSQVFIKRAGYIKRAGWNIFEKQLSEQATLSKEGGNCTTFSSSRRHFFLVKLLNIIVFIINIYWAIKARKQHQNTKKMNIRKTNLVFFVKNS